MNQNASSKAVRSAPRRSKWRPFLSGGVVVVLLGLIQQLNDGYHHTQHVRELHRLSQQIRERDHQIDLLKTSKLRQQQAYVTQIAALTAGGGQPSQWADVNTARSNPAMPVARSGNSPVRAATPVLAQYRPITTRSKPGTRI